MVETVYDLCHPSMFTTTFTANLPVQVFSSSLAIYRYVASRKHESDQNPERTQPGLLLGKTSRVTAPIVPRNVHI